MNISLSTFAPDNLVSRDGFFVVCSKYSKCPDQTKHNFYTMIAAFSAEPDAQDSVMNSQDTDRLRILIEFWDLAEVRHESSLCVFLGDIISFHIAEFGVGVVRVDEGECEALPQSVRFSSVLCVSSEQCAV